jgi:hypothetical protein
MSSKLALQQILKRTAAGEGQPATQEHKAQQKAIRKKRRQSKAQKARAAAAAAAQQQQAADKLALYRATERPQKETAALMSKVCGHMVGWARWWAEQGSHQRGWCGGGWLVIARPLLP